MALLNIYVAFDLHEDLCAGHQYVQTIVHSDPSASNANQLVEVVRPHDVPVKEEAHLCARPVFDAMFAQARSAHKTGVTVASIFCINPAGRVYYELIVQRAHELMEAHGISHEDARVIYVDPKSGDVLCDISYHEYLAPLATS